MVGESGNGHYTYRDRIEALRSAKMRETSTKQDLRGAFNSDDLGILPPPPDRREVVRTMSPSGVPVTDVRLGGVDIRANHPSGGFFGPKAVGENYRRLLEAHPPYIDRMSSLAGGYMANFMSYRKPPWNPDLEPPPSVREATETYQLVNGIGAVQHFCQDLAMGLELGWGGILEKIRHYRRINSPRAADFYDGLENVVLGTQNWIERNAEAARQMAAQEEDPQIRENLEEMARINQKLVTEPPSTFREACQWILWFDMLARMYNGSGSLGKLDELLGPFYERDTANGILTDEEATFHLACLLLRDTAYIQLGGPNASGEDVTNRVSFLVLEATHQLRIPANVGVSVGESISPELLRRGVEIILEDKKGIPKFLGSDSVVEGFARNGYPVELGRLRAYAGCHWYGIPGREYTMMDTVKVNFGAVSEVALREMRSDPTIAPGTAELWRIFCEHLRRAIGAIREAIDFHVEHKHEVFPELVLDLLCYGPIEKGLDASHGGLEFYNMCLDGAGLATVADSFAAIEQRLEQEGRLTWEELFHHLDANWEGPGGERARLMMKSIPRYGSGGARADEWAVRIAREFTNQVKESPTPNGLNMIPGLFSWANAISMGASMGPTPNGRRAGELISHGCNPDPGFRKDGAPTALATAVASVQPGYGNTAPMQFDVDASLYGDDGGVDILMSLIRTHFRLGGTQISLNVLDRNQILEANEDPSKYPDLIVRVTGFSAYFASLSPEFRQLVVDRMIAPS